MERERPLQPAEAQSSCEKGKKTYQPSETKTSDHEAASDIKDLTSSSAPISGQVIGIHSFKELESELRAATRTSQLAILYLTATWSGPCRYMSPIYTSLASQHPKVVFLKADIDEAVEVALRYNVSSIPTFHFIKDEKLVEKVVCVDKALLEKIIAKYAD